MLLFPTNSSSFKHKAGFCTAKLFKTLPLFWGELSARSVWKACILSRPFSGCGLVSTKGIVGREVEAWETSPALPAAGFKRLANNEVAKLGSLVCLELEVSKDFLDPATGVE